MKAVYGTFEFHPWEADVQVSEEVQQSSRGVSTFRNQRIIFSGEVCGDTQSEIITRLEQIKAGFSVGPRSCGLKDDAGNPVVGHWMPSHADYDSNISDVQIVASRFPETKNGEFVTGRSFEITVASLYLEPGSQIFEYKDSLERFGNAGPEYRWVPDKFWGHYPLLITPTTIQKIVHSGYAIGVDNYLLPPDPIYPPPFEQPNLRTVKHIGPDFHPKGYSKFVTSWTYVYMLPTFDDISQPRIPI